MTYCVTSICWLKRHCKFPRPFNYHVCCTILVAKCVSSNDNWLCPTRNEPWYIFSNNRLSENSSAKDISDCTIWGFIHTFEIKFFYTLLIRCYSSAFDAHSIFFDCISGVNCDLVVGLVSCLNAKVIIF